MEQDNSVESLEVLKSENKLLKNLFDTNPESEIHKENLALSYGKLGDAYVSLEQEDNAIEFIELENKFLKELYESNPESNELKNNLAISNSKLGDLYKSLGQFESAIALYESENELLRESFQSSYETKQEYASSCTRLGTAYKFSGQYDKAFKFFDLSYQLFKELYEFNKSEYHKYNYAICYMQFGELYELIGQSEKSLSIFETCSSLFREVHQKDPKFEPCLINFLISLDKLCSTYESLGKKEKVRELLESNLSSINLSECEPKMGNIKMLISCLKSCLKLGELYRSIDKTEKAIEFSEFCHKALFVRSLANPEDDKLKYRIVVSCLGLGSDYWTYERNDKTQKAIEIYELASKLSKELLKSNPDSEEYKSALATSQEKLGMIYMFLDDPVKPLQLFESANNLFKELLEINPDSEAYKLSLALTSYSMGAVYKNSQETQKSVNAFELHNKLFTELHESYPDNAGYKYSIGISNLELGKANLSTSQLESAFRFFESSTKIFEEMYESDPQTETVKETLANSYRYFGDSCFSLKLHDQGTKFYELSHKLFKELYESNLDSESFKKNIVESFGRVGYINLKLKQLDAALNNFESQYTLFKEFYKSNPKSISNFNIYKLGCALNLNTTGIELRKQGRIDEAERLLRDALELDEEVRGSGDPKIAHRLNNLSTILIMKGNYDEARQHLNRAWKIKQATGHNISTPRLLFVRLTLGILQSESLNQYVGQLKSILSLSELKDYADVSPTYDIMHFVEYLRSRLPNNSEDLLSEMSIVINDNSQKSSLDQFELWRNQNEVSLDSNWA